MSEDIQEKEQEQDQDQEEEEEKRSEEESVDEEDGADAKQSPEEVQEKEEVVKEDSSDQAGGGEQEALLPEDVEDEMEEVWQNQTFIPFRGWGKPFSGDVKEYTDRTGKILLSNDLFPSLPLLDGWEWVTDWTIDVFGSFGAVDKEGWCYAVTFESLLESVMEGRSVGENSTSCLVRRRRWIRVRKCVSINACARLKDRIEEQMDVRVSLEKSLADKTNDYEHVMQYESERKKIYEQVTSTCLADILITYQTFLEQHRILEQLKALLEAQSAIERSYAQNLASQSAKFASIVAPETQNLPQKNDTGNKALAFYNTVASQSTPAEMRHDSDKKDDPNSKCEGSSSTTNSNDTGAVNILHSRGAQSVGDVGHQLFASISKFNSKNAEKWSDFSDVIGGSLMQDVSELLFQVKSQLDVSKRYVYWSDISAAPILEKLESSIVLLQYTYFNSAKKIKSKIDSLDDQIFNRKKSNSIECSDEVKAGRRKSLHHRRQSMGLHDEEQQVSMSFPLPGSVKVDKDVVVDMWTSMKSYRKNVINLGNELSLLRLTAQKSVVKEKEFKEALKNILMTSMQVFSHEKGRACMEMGEIMNNERKSFVSRLASSESSPSKVADSSESDVSATDSKGADEAQPLTPLTELPKFHNQILLVSIMQYTTLANAKRIRQQEVDNQSVSKEGILSIKALVTSDGVLHIFLLEGDKKLKEKSGEDVPYRSLLLENCRVVRHFEEKEREGQPSCLENAVEVHPKSNEKDWFGNKKHEALMLIPIDSVESETWVDVLTDPLCGADMLYSALGGGGQHSSHSRRASSSYVSRQRANSGAGSEGHVESSSSAMSLFPSVEVSPETKPSQGAHRDAESEEDSFNC